MSTENGTYVCNSEKRIVHMVCVLHVLVHKHYSITSQWTWWYDSTARRIPNDRQINPTTVTQQCEELTEDLVSEIPELSCNYNAKQEARYLEKSKENMQSDQCIILADFSEN
jgi:hypothetical protein